jgi:hypothetical protein
MSPATMFPALFKRRRRKNRSIADVMANDNWIRDLMLGISAVLFIDYIMMWTLINYVPLDLSQQKEGVIV